jgi:hypothetical protein
MSVMIMTLSNDVNASTSGIHQVRDVREKNYLRPRGFGLFLYL